MSPSETENMYADEATKMSGVMLPGAVEQNIKQADAEYLV